jgi:hypothetical protein
MDFFQKGGGGSEAIQKFWDTFCAPTILEFWAEKGGGVDQIQKFLDTFYPDFGEIQHKNAPKVPGKKPAYKKVSQKFQKSGGREGGGGVRAFLEEVHN